MADLLSFGNDEWDFQMKADAASGKLEFLDRHIEIARKERTLPPLESAFEIIDLTKVREPLSSGGSIVDCLWRSASFPESFIGCGADFRSISLHFKNIGSEAFGLGLTVDGTFVLDWIGPHAEHDRLPPQPSEQYSRKKLALTINAIPLL